MNLRDLVQHSLEKYPDNVWIRYRDLSAEVNDRELTFSAVDELSSQVCEELRKQERCGVALLFDQNSERVIGHFVSLIAVLRSVFIA